MGIMKKMGHIPKSGLQRSQAKGKQMMSLPFVYFTVYGWKSGCKKLAIAVITTTSSNNKPSLLSY